MGSSNIPVQSERNDRIVGQCTIFLSQLSHIFKVYVCTRCILTLGKKKREKKLISAKNTLHLHP